MQNNLPLGIDIPSGIFYKELSKRKGNGQCIMKHLLTL